MKLPQPQPRLARSGEFGGSGLRYLARGFHCGLDALNVHGLKVQGREARPRVKGRETGVCTSRVRASKSKRMRKREGQGERSFRKIDRHTSAARPSQRLPLALRPPLARGVPLSVDFQKAARSCIPKVPREFAPRPALNQKGIECPCPGGLRTTVEVRVQHWLTIVNRYF